MGVPVTVGLSPREEEGLVSRGEGPFFGTRGYGLDSEHTVKRTTVPDYPLHRMVFSRRDTASFVV